MGRHVVAHLAAIEAGEGLFKDGAAAVVEETEVHLPGIAAPVGADVPIGEKALLLQKVQVHQVRVPGEGGGALIGGISVARGGQGQDLPVPLAGPVEVVHEVIGRLAQGAHAIGGR